MKYICKECGTQIEESMTPYRKEFSENGNSISYKLIFIPSEDLCKNCDKKLQKYAKKFFNDVMIIDNIRRMVNDDKRITKINLSISIDGEPEENLTTLDLL